MDKIQDLFVRARMPIFKSIMNVFKWCDSAFQFVFQLGWYCGVGFDNVAPVYTAPVFLKILALY